MIIYKSNKAGFIEDTRNCSIVEKLQRNFAEREGRRASPGEERAWQSSLQYVANALDEASNPNLVVIELKQWSESVVTDEDGILAAPRHGAALTPGPHPSYQAWSYAELLRNFNTECAPSSERSAVQVRPCAYLHNYSPKGAEHNVLDPRYAEYLNAAPVFLGGPSEQKHLKSFLKRFLVKGDRGRTIEIVENGEIRPSKALADSIAGMIRGNREFVLIDEQKTIFEHVRSLVLQRSKLDPKKRVVIVKGGPGTGKSVVAVNLLAALTAKQKLCCYVSKNAAPRAVYSAKLSP